MALTVRIGVFFLKKHNLYFFGWQAAGRTWLLFCLKRMAMPDWATRRISASPARLLCPLFCVFVCVSWCTAAHLIYNVCVRLLTLQPVDPPPPPPLTVNRPNRNSTWCHTHPQPTTLRMTWVKQSSFLSHSVCLLHKTNRTPTTRPRTVTVAHIHTQGRDRKEPSGQWESKNSHGATPKFQHARVIQTYQDSVCPSMRLSGRAGNHKKRAHAQNTHAHTSRSL